jgi:hypothetical protein
MAKRITVLLPGHVTRLGMVYPKFSSERLPQPDVILQEITEDLECALRRSFSSALGSFPRTMTPSNMRNVSQE